MWVYGLDIFRSHNFFYLLHDIRRDFTMAQISL